MLLYFLTGIKSFVVKKTISSVYRQIRVSFYHFHTKCVVLLNALRGSHNFNPISNDIERSLTKLRAQLYLSFYSIESSPL